MTARDFNPIYFLAVGNKVKVPPKETSSEWFNQPSMTALGILGAYGLLVCFIKPVIDFKLVESENTAFLRRLVSLVDKSLRPVCAKLSHLFWTSPKHSSAWLCSVAQSSLGPFYVSLWLWLQKEPTANICEYRLPVAQLGRRASQPQARLREIPKRPRVFPPPLLQQKDYKVRDPLKCSLDLMMSEGLISFWIGTAPWHKTHRYSWEVVNFCNMV